MKLLLIPFIILSLNSFANDGLSIPNSFQVDKEGNVFRGREPRSLVNELAHLGITDVIIFKNEIKDEVQKEIAALNELGLKSHHIPFVWKNFPSMVEACEQTIDALNIIHKVKAKNNKVFFHCTLGEDRTGMLAGLYRMLEENLSEGKAFKLEMCARGYSDGNIQKPAMVTHAIKKELTPLFLALSAKIQSGEWKLGKLSKQSCKNITIAPTQLKCRP
jgi:protein-tyrosine phosphatase